MLLMSGPLYHLTDKAAGGVLIAAAISRFASLLDGLRRERFGYPRFARLVGALS